MALTPGTPVTPLHQPPAEDLRNAAAIARAVSQAGGSDNQFRDFARIEELIASALGKLAEPHPITIDRARVMLNAIAVEGRPSTDQEQRDAAQVITTAALEWR